MEKLATKWKRPPVTEVIIGVQFEQLSKLTNGHLGWFWGEMHGEFPGSSDAPALPRGSVPEDENLAYLAPGFVFGTATGESRLRMSSADGSRMVQVQNGWLIANWLRRDEVQEYPGYSGVKSVFDKAFQRFAAFCELRNLGTIKPNLWEVSYVDHVPRETVWTSHEDLPRVFPGLFGTGACPGGKLEGSARSASWYVPGLPARVQMVAESSRDRDDRDLLVIQSTARGPLKWLAGADNAEVDAANLSAQLNAGQDVLVETFKSCSSEGAKAYWRGE